MAWLENSKERVQSRNASPTVQFKAQTFPRGAQVKVEWSLHSDCSYTFWGSDTEKKFRE